jgi:hypothetical protein
MDIHKTEDALMAYLLRQGAAIIERYGDSRNPKNFDDGRVN